MPEQPYDPVGAMGGLFAPAYIHGNPEAEAAAAKWQAENFAMTPAMVEATRGPSTTVTSPGGGIRTGGVTTTTIPGSVDPAALKIMAQGGKYKGTIPAPAPTPAPVGGTSSGVGGGTGGVRDAIASQLMASGGLMRQQPPAGGIPPGMQMAYSPLEYLMGDGDNTGFMQGSFGGGA
jgi:hypothetical protein